MPFKTQWHHSQVRCHLADSVWHIQGGLVYPDYVSAMFTAPNAELIR
ncbi:hypothetical protein VINE108274_12565 [Vibrio neptunius]